MSRHPFIAQERAQYPVRVLAALATSLLLVTAAVRWWPLATPDEIVFDDRAQELIRMEEIVPTRQQARRPPPPVPVVPVVVPDDMELDAADIELPDQLVTEPGDVDGSDAPSTTGSNTAVRPTAGPRPVRFVEPEYTAEARRKKVRAELVLEVMVDARGRVQHARVVEHYLLEGNDPILREAVERIGFGLEESAIAAAEQYVFRPAVQDGRNVQSFTTLTFRFGV